MQENIKEQQIIELIARRSNIYVATIHSIVDPANDSKIEKILSNCGKILYKKYVHLNFNGYVWLNLICYRHDPKHDWLGNLADNYEGAQYHANQSIGIYPIRIVVFQSETLNDVLIAKSKIRNLFTFGNFSIHINDFSEEAMLLSQLYFNKNSLFFINNCPFKNDFRVYDKKIEEFKSFVKENKFHITDFAITGSSVLELYNIRASHDMDFITINNIGLLYHPIFSNHISEQSFYQISFKELITNPEYYFYYKGVKHLTPKVISDMKIRRNENPKDIQDIKLLNTILKGKILK